MSDKDTNFPPNKHRDGKGDAQDEPAQPTDPNQQRVPQASTSELDLAPGIDPSDMAEITTEDYTSQWDEFKLRTNEKQKTVEFLKTLKRCDFSQIRSMVSIGAGEAEVDFEVIRCSCPKLDRYIAVDPRKEALDKIQEKFSQLPNVQVSLVEKTIKTYSGPEDPVDLVFVCNSSYYFRSEYHEQMQRALEWLTPEGVLIDIRDNIEDFPYRQKLSEFPAAEGSTQALSQLNIKAMGAEPGVSMKSTQKQFLSWCVENGWEVDGQVDNRDFTIDYSIDISEPGLDQVLKMLVHTLPQEDMEKAKDVINESVIKGTTRVPGKQLVIIVSRAKETGDQAAETEGSSGDQAAETRGSGDQAADDTEAVTSEKKTQDEELNGERSQKVPRLEEKTENP